MDADSFDLVFTLTPSDYRAMMRAYWRLTPARRFWVVFLRALAVLGAALAAFSWWETEDITDAVFAACLLLSPVAAALLNRAYYDKVFVKQRLGAGPTEVKANADGVTKSGPNGVSRFAWRRVRRVVASKRHILLWITSDKAVIVPCRAFPDDAQRGQFLSYVRKSAAGPEL